MFLDIRPYLTVFLGFLLVVCGLSSAVFYQNPRLEGLYTFLATAGIASTALGLLVIRSQWAEDKIRARQTLLMFQVAVRHMVGRVYCTDCEHYSGLFEVSVRNVDGRPAIHQEPRFSEGLCMRIGRIIEDGFRQRRCGYYRRRK